jgi:uncharacterized protein YdcH (DUF465 family)
MSNIMMKSAPVVVFAQTRIRKLEGDKARIRAEIAKLVDKLDKLDDQIAAQEDKIACR